jgi:tryptophan synthase alpha chain
VSRFVPLEERLRARRGEGRKLLVPYVTGGLGADWPRMVEAFAAAGADAIEVGIPFSDPAMDGPTIQEASQRALDAGITPVKVLEGLAQVDVDGPLVVMTYANIAFRAGATRFASELAQVGVSGAILPDLPLEEADPWIAGCDKAGVANVLLAAPTAPDERLPRICARTQGFVYAVGVVGVTGERSSLAPSAVRMAERLKRVTDVPVIVGIGVSTPDQAVTISGAADGVVVASAIIRRVLEGASVDAAASHVAEFRRALDEVGT